jgi:hypothetical protein
MFLPNDTAWPRKHWFIHHAEPAFVKSWLSGVPSLKNNAVFGKFQYF